LLGNIVFPGERSVIGSLRYFHGMPDIVVPQHEKLGHVGKVSIDILSRRKCVGMHLREDCGAT
jgi:hypothetical protein